MTHRFRMTALVLLLCAGPAAAQAPEGEVLTASHPVTVRAAPDPGAEELRTLPMGVVLRSLDRSEGRSAIGGVEDHWYQVRLPPTFGEASARTGWVFGGSIVPYERGRRIDALREALDRVAPREDDSETPIDDHVRTLIALESGLVRELGSTGGPEYDVLRLEVIDLAAGWLFGLLHPPSADPLFETWFLSRRDLLDDGAPGDVTRFVARDAWWEIHERHADTDLAEEIAWRAAAAKPHYCEAWADCFLLEGLEGNGEYLRLYPAGEHVEAALESLRFFIETAVTYACRTPEDPPVSRELLIEVSKILEPLDEERVRPLRMDLQAVVEQCGLEPLG